MITLTSVEPLFEDEAAVPKDTLKEKALEDFKLTHLAGVPESKIEITLEPGDGGDILVKVIDPHASSGYLVFQDENTYNDWLNTQLFEPTQDEIMEAANRG